MADLSHTFGQDLEVDSSGDLALVTGPDWTTQSFTHRLLTQLGSYIWELTYGTGLPQMVGTTVNLSTITSIVQAQAALEVGIDQTQPVSVASTVDPTSGSVNLLITYTDAASGDPQIFTL